jgi:hypothetical protein
MKNNTVKIILLIVVGILFIWLSQYSNIWWGRRGDGYTPFFFPAAFVLAAVYGLWSRSYPGAFLVGFLSIPYLIPFPPFQSGSVILSLIRTVFGMAHTNIVDLIIFIGFGIAAGLFGMGFVKLAKRRSRSRSLS